MTAETAQRLEQAQADRAAAEKNYDNGDTDWSAVEAARSAEREAQHVHDRALAAEKAAADAAEAKRLEALRVELEEVTRAASKWQTDFQPEVERLIKLDAELAEVAKAIEERVSTQNRAASRAKTIARELGEQDSVVPLIPAVSIGTASSYVRRQVGAAAGKSGRYKSFGAELLGFSYDDATRGRPAPTPAPEPEPEPALGKPTTPSATPEELARNRAWREAGRGA